MSARGARVVALAVTTFWLAGVVAVVAPASTEAVSPSDAIARLNAQRAAHGFPANVVEEPNWSAGCRRHNAYQALNGGALTHHEEPGRPGYSSDGAFAGAHAVLAQGQTWIEGNPWETAPIHLHQLLHPRLERAGVSDDARYSCFTTWPGAIGPPPATVTTYSYPGHGTTHRYEEVASEDPYTPGQRVGLPAGTKTGPYLYVLADAPQGVDRARVVTASIVGAGGAVRLAAVDNYTPGIERFIPAGAELIPIDPLRPSTIYTANVELDLALSDGSVVRTSRTWYFRTIRQLPGALSIDFSRTTLRDRSLLVSVRCSGGPCRSRVQARWARRARSSRIVRLRAGQRRTVRLRAGPRNLQIWIDGRRVASFG